MIKDFETYIREGRMGRLIDASRNNEQRKEDDIKTFDDMESYLLDTYETKNGRSFFVKYNMETEDTIGVTVTIDLTDHLGILLYKCANGFVFTKIFIPTKIVSGIYGIMQIREYMSNTIGIDMDVYDIDFDRGQERNIVIERRDRKTITPSEFFTEIYDKIVTNGNPDKLNVRHKQTN